MKLPFPSHQPSVLHSSPLWLLACRTGLSQVSVGAVYVALHIDKLYVHKLLTGGETKKKDRKIHFQSIAFLPHNLPCNTEF